MRDIFSKDLDSAGLDEIFEMGQAYYLGEKVTRDLTKAVSLWRGLVDKAHPEAQWRISETFGDIQGPKDDFSENFNYLFKASALGLTEAWLIVERILELSDLPLLNIDPALVYPYWCLKAGRGQCPTAQHILGVLFYTGQGAEKNRARAERFFRLSADQGKAQSRLALAQLHLDGEAGEKNLAQAAEYWLLDAAMDVGAAQANLGLAYYYGKGVEIDHAQAVKYLGQAEAKGFPQAQYVLGLAYLDGKGAKKNQKWATLYLKKAAAQGFGPAQAKLNEIWAR
ncbi:MAG: sel1 repeat family protein [Deltaproteobacteria bacterium]|nr:sel1 repeat family protein [Deltaproteobacteria bacterium]